MSLIHLEKEDFNHIISTDVTVVDFFATWCGPCKMISPIIEKLANDMTNVKFVKIDVDKHDDLARIYGIMSIPTLIFFKDGKEIKRHIGFINEDKIKEIINEIY